MLAVKKKNHIKKNILDLNNLSIEDARYLNQVSYQIRKPFLDLMDDLYNQSDNCIGWHVNQLLSRNYYSSNLFQNCCFLAFVKEKLANGALDQIIVFPQLANIIKDYCKKNGFHTEIVTFGSPLYHKIKSIINNFNSAYLRLKWIFQFIKAKELERAIDVPKAEEIILIDTFLLSDGFTKKGKHQDRYYDGLLDMLSKKQREYVFFLPHIDKAATVGQHSKFAERPKKGQFILKHDFLSLTDYLIAFWNPVRLKKLRWKKFKFYDFEVGCLLEREFYSNQWDISSFFGILNYRFFKRLRENGVKLKLVINWFENQVIDRGFNRGLYDFFPNVYCKGYQGFLPSRHYLLHLLPTITEENNSVIPNEIAVIGTGLIEEVKLFYPELKVSLAPAFRFTKLKSCIDQRQAEVSNFNILIPLPIGLQDGIEVIRIMHKAFSSNFDRDNVQFQIKPHPVLNAKKLKSKCIKADLWNRNFKMVQGDFYSLLRKCDLVIGSGSSTLVEACACGIPVIILGSRSGLTLNPIPDSVPNAIWKLCYGSIEVAQSINYYVGLGTSERNKLKEIGYWIQKNYFEPVTKESVRKFLMLEN